MTDLYFSYIYRFKIHIYNKLYFVDYFILICIKAETSIKHYNIINLFYQNHYLIYMYYFILLCK